jgi:hypothetical protein
MKIKVQCLKLKLLRPTNDVFLQVKAELKFFYTTHLLKNLDNNKVNTKNVAFNFGGQIQVKVVRRLLPGNLSCEYLQT